jgi:hypothetical protein
VASIGGTTVTPDPVKAGQQVTFSTYVTVSCDTKLLIDIGVYGPASRVMHVQRDNIRFRAGVPQQVTMQGLLPAGTQSGIYRVAVFVYQAGGGSQYTWNNSASSLAVQ